MRPGAARRPAPCRADRVGGAIEHALGLRSTRIEVALSRPAHRALLDRGIEVQLEVRIGQHDRADVTTGHDDPAVCREGPLALEERRPERGDRADLGHVRVDLRAADGVGHVTAVTQDAGQVPVVIVGELELLDEVDERICIVAADPPVKRQPGDRAVQQAGVEEAVAELAGRGGAHAALARRTRSIERNDECLRARRSRRHPGQDTGSQGRCGLPAS